MIDEETLRRRFDSNEPFTIGIEEEVLLLDPRTHEPSPVADEVVRAAGSASVKRELPTCQVELMTSPHRTPEAAAEELASLRRLLTDVCNGSVVPAAAAVHPRSVADTGDALDERYRHIHQLYGEVARRQVVGAIQIHVAVGSADRALAVYNALRGYLPEIAALAASAPFHEGRDTGLASIRPMVSAQLPRQGVPPAIPSWSDFAEELRWGAVSGSVPEPRQWWWELRPHPTHGTLELRVPDVQADSGSSMALAQFVDALVRQLCSDHEEGQDLGSPATWRIAENRWSALRYGTGGHLADLVTGEPVPTRRRLHDLLDRIEPQSTAGLDQARQLVERNGAEQLRAVGVADATAWLLERFRT